MPAGLEPSWVVTRVAEQAQVSEREVLDFLSVAHRVVDELVTNDVTVLAPPLLIAECDDPVFERIRVLLRDEQWDLGPGGLEATPEEVVAATHLPLDVVEMYPFVGSVGVLVKIMDVMQEPDTELERRMDMLESWLDTYRSKDGAARHYRVSPVGKESAFESWLEANLDVLKTFGYRIRLADARVDGVSGRQLHLNKRSVPDLICRFTHECERGHRGDWLVIENKVTAVGSAAFHQLSRYVDFFRTNALVAPKAGVHGLLISDGTSIDLRRALRERNFDHVSLTALGYRDLVHADEILAPEPDPDETSVPYAGTVVLEDVV